MVTLKIRKKLWFTRALTLLFVCGLLGATTPPQPAHALANGDGLTVYAEESVQTPRWRTWTNSTNTYSSEASLPTVNGVVHQIQIAAAPNGTGAIAAVQNDGLFSNQLRVLRYNGTSWSSDWQASIGFNTSAPRFDVAYSQSTGQGFVVYSANTGSNNELRYRTFNGTSWSAEQSYNAQRTSGTVAYVRAEARPGTDEIAVIWADDSNMDMSANYYNMATNTWSGEPAAALSTNIARNGTGTSVNSAFADLAFEQVSGKLQVCWGDEGVADLKCVTRTAGTGGSWGSVTTYSTFAVQPVEMHLASEPGTNYIAYTADDDAGTPSGEVGIWNGSTWGNIDNYAVNSLNSNDGSTTNTSVGWVRSGSQSRAIVTFDNQLVAGVDWRVFNKNTSTWATQTPFTGAPVASNFNDRMHIMKQNPLNPSQLMFLQREFGDDLMAKKIVFDGANITWSSVEPGGVGLETTMPNRNLGYGWSGDFAYYGQDNSPALTYDQTSYRFFANTDSTDVGAPLSGKNTVASLAASGDAFRLRQDITVSGGTLEAGAKDFKLQYAGKGFGSCDSPSGTPSTYTDVTSSTPIAYKDNPTPTSDSALTSNSNDPSPDVNETYVETNNFTANTDVPSGDAAMWDFALYDNSAPASTAYCLRIVKSNGTPLDTYSKNPQITTSSGVTNTAPTSPTSLAQTKTSGTTLSTGAWTNESSVKFTASVSDPDSSDTLQLCVEKKPIGQSFTNTEDSCSTGVAYSGTPVSTNVTIGSHTENEYHWQARTKDAAGAYSSWVSYGGNAESARDYGVDTSAPTGGTVYDGTSAGVDAAFNDNSLSSLSANWSGVNSGLSGLDHYEYSIGTSPGNTSVKGWTSTSTSTSVTATGLSLHTSQPYYVNVRAIDNAGNTQTGITSDGQLVLPSLSFGVSSPTLTLDNLNASNNYTDSKTTTLTTSTNAYGGYVIRAFANDYLRNSGLQTIPDFTGGSYAAPDSWQSSDTGLGYTSNDTSVQGANKFQAATCPGGNALASPGCFAPFSQSAPGDIVADHASGVSGTPVTNEQFTLTYRVTAPSGQAANSYQTTIIYSALPVY